MSAPKANPVTWAANATPPPEPGWVSEKSACQSSKTNQSPRKIEARSGNGISPKSSVTTRARGRITKYAPSTPAIAPDAPTVGMLAACVPAQWSVTHACPSAATKPDAR